MASGLRYAAGKRCMASCRTAGFSFPLKFDLLQSQRSYSSTERISRIKGISCTNACTPRQLAALAPFPCISPLSLPTLTADLTRFPALVSPFSSCVSLFVKRPFIASQLLKSPKLDDSHPLQKPLCVSQFFRPQPSDHLHLVYRTHVKWSRSPSQYFSPSTLYHFP